MARLPSLYQLGCSEEIKSLSKLTSFCIIIQDSYKIHYWMEWLNDLAMLQMLVSAVNECFTYKNNIYLHFNIQFADISCKIKRYCNGVYDSRLSNVWHSSSGKLFNISVLSFFPPSVLLFHIYLLLLSSKLCSSIFVITKKIAFQEHNLNIMLMLLIIFYWFCVLCCWSGTGLAS